MNKRVIKAVIFCLFLLGVNAVIYYSHPFFEISRSDRIRFEQTKKIAKKDRIDLAMKQEFDKTFDPALNYIPVTRLKVANQVRDNQVKKRAKSKAVSLVWEERGPNNVGGRTRALMWDPNDVNNTKVWAGSVTGGLWFNNNITSAASQWHSVDDTWNNMAISVITYDPNNTNIMYAGTGEGHIVGSSRGAGIFKTTDGGITWTQMTSANGFHATDEDFHYVNDMVVKDESGNSVLYVGTQGSINDDFNAPSAVSGERGLWRSTDGGVTFSQVLPNVPSTSYNYSVADIELSASGRIFIGTTSDYVSNGSSVSFRGGGGTILYSDDGTSWGVAYSPGSGRRVELACAPSNADIVYAMAADGNDIGWLVSTISGDDPSPTSWSNLSIPTYTEQSCAASASDFSRGQAWYDLIMAVDPNDPISLIIGGIDLLKSTNGGVSFDLISYWTGACDVEVHADQHAIVFNPNNIDEAIIGNDGGVYYSSNLGTSTNPSFGARNNGYNVTQFYGAAIHPTAGTEHYLAGAQDNGSQRFTNMGMNSTTQVSGGDGAYCNIDQDETQYQWTQYVFNSFYRSTNGGTSFSNSFSVGVGQTGRFINPTRYDDVQNIMYAAAEVGEYMRWNDPQTGTSGTYVTVSALSAEQVSAVTVSPNIANRIFLGTGADFSGSTTGGHLYIVDNANTGTTKTAVDISDAAFPSNGYISSIDVEDGDDDHILIAFSNYGVSSLWETVDGGSNWTEVEGNLPDMPVRWAEFHPQDVNRAFIATELGVWSTDNLNSTFTNWETHTADGFPNVRTDMLQIRTADNTMIAATHGRGLFSADISLPSSSEPEVSFAISGSSVMESNMLGAGCREYADHDVNLIIINPPTGDALITVSANTPNTTANSPSDFEIITPMPITFTSGNTNTQTVTLRVYDDMDLETQEIIELGFIIEGTTDAIPGSEKQTHTIIITDNDAAPAAVISTSIMTENWEGSISDWLVDQLPSGNSRNYWNISSNCNAIDGLTAQIVSEDAGNTYCGYWNETVPAILYKEVDAIGFTNLNISFDYMSGGISGSHFGSLVYSLDTNIPNWIQIGADYQGQESVTAITNLVLPPVLDGTTFLIGWQWTSSASGAANPLIGFSIDNIVITGDIMGDEIESNLSASSDQYLGPNASVLFYDESSGDLIAIIENESAHDYGCTSVTIDRTGTSAAEFWESGTANYMMDKTVMITPTSNNTSGTYTITLYFSQTEIDGWTAITGKTVLDMTLAKTSLPVYDITAISTGDVGAELGTDGTASTYGTGWAVSASFTTGFSGIGAGDPGPPPVALPLELISFKAHVDGENSNLSWVSATEINTDYIGVETSKTAENFKQIGIVEAAGESNEKLNYKFVHRNTDYGNHYYRLKMVDRDGSYEYSDVVSVFQSSSNFELQDIYPNPADTNLSLKYNNDNVDDVVVTVVGLSGQLIHQKYYSSIRGKNDIEVDTRDYADGIYIINLQSAGRYTQRKISIKH